MNWVNLESELKSVAIASNTQVDNAAFLFDEAVGAGEEYWRDVANQRTLFIAGGITGTITLGTYADGMLPISIDSGSTYPHTAYEKNNGNNLEIRCSKFGNDAAALQSALNWTHVTGGWLIQDNEITISTNVHHGNLRVKAGGGRWHVLGDSNFVQKSTSGAWADEVGILTRSANLNTEFGDAVTTQYLVQIDKGVQIDLTRTDDTGPFHSTRFMGLAPESYTLFNSYSYGEGTRECSGPAWYFYNQCKVGGHHVIVLSDEDAPGGIWIQQIGIGGNGVEYASNYEFVDGLSVDKTLGTDEALAIFNSSGVDGQMYVSGAAPKVHSTHGLGFTILNNNEEIEGEFDVTLSGADVVCDNVKDGNQGVIKIKNCAAQLGPVRAVMKGHDTISAGVGAVINIVDDTQVQKPPYISSAKCVIDGTLTAGTNQVDMVKGNVFIDNLVTLVTTGSSAPRYSVNSNLLGCIKGGDLAAGGTACARSSVLDGRIICRGIIIDCPHADIERLLWDVDSFPDNAVQYTNAGPNSWLIPQLSTFKCKQIYAYGTTQPSRVIQVVNASMILSADYVLNYANVLVSSVITAPANNDQASDRWRNYNVYWTDGTTPVRKFKEPLYRFVMLGKYTVDASTSVISHTLGTTPLGAVAQIVPASVSQYGYNAQPSGFTSSQMSINISDASGAAITTGTFTVTVIAFISGAEIYQ